MYTIKKTKLLSFLVVLSILFISCDKDDDIEEQPVDVTGVYASIQEKTDAIYDDLVTIHRDFHQNPELSGEEVMTSGKVKDYLINLGLEVKTNIGGYGVVGILRGKEPGKTIAWRADMDALPNDDINFPDPVPYASNIAGVRHTCGHDVHTTIALGIANVLTGIKDKLKGDVVFVFQPAEETGEGAKDMINDGFYNIVQPDEIYASHVFPLPVGLIATNFEGLFAYNNSLSFKIEKKQYTSNPEEFVKTLLNNISNVPDNFWYSFDDPQIGWYSDNSIYREYLTWMEETFSIVEDETHFTFKTLLAYTDKDEIDAIPNRIQELIAGTEYENSLNSIHITDFPGVYNDPGLTSEAINTIGSINGVESIMLHPDKMPGFNDDFCYFQENTPGVYFFLGGSDFEKGIISMTHTPNFVVDERCINFGVSAFSSLLFERLNK